MLGIEDAISVCSILEFEVAISMVVVAFQRSRVCSSRILLGLRLNIFWVGFCLKCVLDLCRAGLRFLKDWFKVVVRVAEILFICIESDSGFR